MPGGDGTGPGGMGPMSGRAAGYCAGYPVPGYMNPTGGRGMGWGRGMGRGRGMGWGRGRGVWGAPYGAPQAGYVPGAIAPGAYAPVAPSPDQELTALKGQADYVTSALEDIKTRIGELEAGQKTEK